MPNRSLTIEQVLTLLAATPPRIAALSAGLAPAQLHTSPHPAAWSANEVLAHLRACADMWGNCMVAIITQDTPTLRAVNPRTWIRKTDYLEQKFRPSLRAFAAQRTDLLNASCSRCACSNDHRLCRRPNTACTRLVGVCAFLGNFCGSKLVPSKRLDLVPPTSG